MERIPNQPSIPVPDYSGSASEQQPSAGHSTDRQEGGYQSDGHPLSQPFFQKQQPDNPPPKWARILVRLILESSTTW